MSDTTVVKVAGARTKRAGIAEVDVAGRTEVSEVSEASEVAASVRTTVDIARRFADDGAKNPITVRDNPGFVVNALLFPYLNRAVRMLDDGIASKEDIDAAMRGGCGFPMGPLELLDLIGLDTALAILDALDDDRRDPCAAPAPLLKRMVTAEHLGRKTGQGFYTYPNAR